MKKEFGLAEAHEWLDGLKTAERDVTLQAMAALKALMSNRGHGSVTVIVVAGALKQTDLKQSYRGGR